MIPKLIFIFLAASIILYISLAFASRFGFVDYPSERKFQKHPIPRVGGLSFVIPFYCMALFWESPWSWSILTAGFIVFLGGLWDDLGKINRARQKLFFQILACGIFSVFFPIQPLNLYEELTFRMLVFCVTLSSVNSFNLMDNMNGLTAGLSLILLGGMSFIFSSKEEYDFILIFMISILPFFCLNFPFGKIFMGDQGSQFLGFMLPALFFENLSKKFQGTSPQFLGSILGLFIMLLLFAGDTVWVMILRIREGRSIFIGDQCHISHCLHRRGIPQWGVALILYLVQVILIFFGSYWVRSDLFF